MFKQFLSFLTDALFVVFGFGPDVVTVTSGTAGNAGSTAAELITLINIRVSKI